MAAVLAVVQDVVLLEDVGEVGLEEEPFAGPLLFKGVKIVSPPYHSLLLVDDSRAAGVLPDMLGVVQQMFSLCHCLAWSN